MKYPFLSISMAFLIIISCTKEKSEEGDGAVMGSLLMRTVAKLGTDSLTSNYNYDGSKRLINYQSIVDFQGVSDESEIQFVRNGDGIIQQVIIINSQLAPLGGSISFKMNYDAARKRYTSRVASYGLSGFTFKDSIAYTYDGSGNITREEEFLDDGTRGGYGEYIKTEYNYDGNSNIVKATDYEYDPIAGNYDALTEVTYEYDNNVNPLKLSIEAFIIDSDQAISDHNVTKIAVKNLVNPAESETTTFVYTYNGDKKPASALVSSTAFSGASLPVSFIYQ